MKYKCKYCSFSSDYKNTVESHIRNEHRNMDNTKVHDTYHDPILVEFTIPENVTSIEPIYSGGGDFGGSEASGDY